MIKIIRPILGASAGVLITLPWIIYIQCLDITKKLDKIDQTLTKIEAEENK